MSDMAMKFRLFGQDVTASRTLRGVGDEAKRTGDGIGKHIGAGTIAAGAALGGLAIGGIAAVVGGFGNLVNGARDAARITRLNEQVIKTTGGAAHVTAGQVDDLATAISNKTGIDDDAIKSSANLLLTFTDIRNEVGKGNDIFNQATGMVQDMSAALGQDGKASAIQLGKALNDPIKGVTALSKVGVSFTEQQKAQIKTLTEHGDKLGAQKLILKELGREFGGAAVAATDPMQKLGTVVTNLGEGLAGKLLPWLDTFATWMIDTGVPAIEKIVTWLGDNLGPVIADVAEWVTTTLVPALMTAGQWLGEHLPPVIAAISDFISGTMIPAIKNLADGFMQNVWPAIQKVAGIIAENLQPVITALGEFWTNTLLPAWLQAQPILAKLATIIGVVIGVIAVVVSWIVGKLAPIWMWLASKIIPAVIWVIGKVVDTFLAVVDAVVGIWQSVSENFGKVIGFVTGLPSKIASAASGLWDGIKDSFRAALNWIFRAWNDFKLQFPSFDFDWNGSLPGGEVSVGGWTVDTPNIPLLARGGITRGLTAAVLGDNPSGREMVVPLERAREFGFGGGGGNLQVVVQVGAAVSTEKDIANAVTRGIMAAKAQGWRPPAGWAV